MTTPDQTPHGHRGERGMSTDIRPRAGSLFSGVAGLDLAVTAVTGAEPVWFAENDPAAAAVLAERFPGVPNLGDITDVDWLAVEPIGILTGGFPCQDLSLAGRRAGLRPGRGIRPAPLHPPVLALPPGQQPHRHRSPARRGVSPDGHPRRHATTTNR
jgi:C-5 cytosine-specific DNA methylase